MAKKKPKSHTTKTNRFSKTNQPTSSKAREITDKINEDVIAAALSAINAPVLIKMCRLCETKDGPFLNIFDSSTKTAKKLEDLMPFTIEESDDLPHKICFRCSAKVEELHEFVEKCIKTQNSLHEALGKKAPVATKNKIRTKWEEKLNKSNISNDDICDALIKKAMEGIKNIPLNKTAPLDDDDKPLKTRTPESNSDTAILKPVSKNEPKVNNDSEITLKHVKLSIEKCDKKPLTNAPNEQNTSEYSSSNTKDSKQKHNQNTVKSKGNYEKTDSTADKKSEEVNNDPPFNIMEYVTMIKVNSVGILFQCKLCNRNFLKREVVETHGCAKTGIPKIDLTANIPPPEPPKPPSTVKYIKIDGSTKRPAVNKDKESEETKKETVVSKEEKSDAVKKPKPKIGPASKKRALLENNPETESQNESSVKSNTESNSEISTAAPLVNFSANPNLNKFYKLIPGPNNTFQLVDGHDSAIKGQPVETATLKTGSKRKYSDDENTAKSSIDKSYSSIKEKSSSTEVVIDLENDTESPGTVEKPYPVGLFQRMSHQSTSYPSTSASEVPSFTTPAMKKQSYTVVRMSNPSKLVISTKPIPPAENVPKKKAKKSKTEENPNQSKEPYNVTIEDVTPNKEPGFFTFINVDPLLQPSYVLPTSNIIQESQISTSTPAVKNKSDTKEKYSCNMCGEQFSREKKLLAHIQSHYTKMDEEDKLREKSISKKRGKKT